MRLPFDTRITGDVAVLAPIAAGAIAHREAHHDIQTKPVVKTKGGMASVVRTVTVYRPRCITRAQVEESTDRYSVMSGGWADKHDAIACPTCFAPEEPVRKRR